MSDARGRERPHDTVVDEPYPGIDSYALIADCHSAALVSRAGSVDWACLRRFDAGSAFGRLLDWELGGHFSLTPRALRDVSRRYIDETMVLETTFETASGSVRILDAFNIGPGPDEPVHQLIRIVEGVDGHVDVNVVIQPRFDYGTLQPWLRRQRRGDDGDGGDDQSDGAVYVFIGGDDALVVRTDADGLRVDQDGAQVTGSLHVTEGARVRFSAVSHPAHDIDRTAGDLSVLDDELEHTLSYWRDWSSETLFDGPARELVRRSAVVLKSLTCGATGAIVAAPTTSLPEKIGGDLNWDYRYSWVRDSTLTLEALTRVNHPDVAQSFLDFILRSAAGSAADLQLMYGPYGERRLIEFTVDLEGWRGSRPVRVGNQASEQLQLDMYGHVLDAAYHGHREEHVHFDRDEWGFLRQVVDAAADRWDQPDRGVWEARGERRHFTYSKVMVWVALDRGIRLVEEGQLDGDVGRWTEVRDRIRGVVDTRGVHDGHFTQVLGTDSVDATLLRLPLLGFVDACDQRMVATVDVIRDELSVPPHGLLRRRVAAAPTDDGDAKSGESGVFLLVNFWLVDVLLLQGRVDDAEALFNALVDVSNDVGLFSEIYDPDTDELLGNFPQTFTHLGLINSAVRLAAARCDADTDRAHGNHDQSSTANDH